MTTGGRCYSRALVRGIMRCRRWKFAICFFILLGSGAHGVPASPSPAPVPVEDYAAIVSDHSDSPSRRVGARWGGATQLLHGVGWTRAEIGARGARPCFNTCAFAVARAAPGTVHYRLPKLPLTRLFDSGHRGSGVRGGHSSYSAAIGFMGESDNDYSIDPDGGQDLEGVDGDGRSNASFGSYHAFAITSACE